MEEKYRIRGGCLESRKINISFTDGLIFLDNGIYFIEIYFPEHMDLNVHMNNENFLREYFELSAKTDDKCPIFASRLGINAIIPSKSMMKFVCNGYIKKVNKIISPKEEILDKEVNNSPIYYTELEGLKMVFSDLTEKPEYRKGEKVDNFMDFARDHTSTILTYNGKEQLGNNFGLTFSKMSDNDNIIVKFEQKQNNELKYGTFLAIKGDLLALISFINGAEVQIRRECTGTFYQPNKPHSEIEFHYSFKKVENLRYNNYIPIADEFHWGKNLMNNILFNCFNSFVSENKKLDFSSIIFYLNGATQAKSLQEAYFISIIAFERLSHKYDLYLRENENLDAFFIKEDDFKELKKRLQSAIKNFKLDLKNQTPEDKEWKEIIKGLGKINDKIGQLNFKRKSVKSKFMDLLEYANIKKNSKINKLLSTDRHLAIHQGDIGKEKSAYENYYTLDELIRDILLNLIKYDGIRKSKFY